MFGRNRLETIKSAENWLELERPQRLQIQLNFLKIIFNEHLHSQRKLFTKLDSSRFVGLWDSLMSESSHLVVFGFYLYTYKLYNCSLLRLNGLSKNAAINYCSMNVVDSLYLIDYLNPEVFGGKTFLGCLPKWIKVW